MRDVWQRNRAHYWTWDQVKTPHAIASQLGMSAAGVSHATAQHTQKLSTAVAAHLAQQQLRVAAVEDAHQVLALAHTIHLHIPFVRIANLHSLCPYVRNPQQDRQIDRQTDRQRIQHPSACCLWSVQLTACTVSNCLSPAPRTPPWPAAPRTAHPTPHSSHAQATPADK